jgi:ABC-type molybdate transport system substrate-binding protein
MIFAALALAALWLAPQNAGAQAASGGTIYSAGSYQNAANKLVPCYWEGTVKRDLPAGSGNAKATAIVVVTE